ncbi:hypothetical protein EG835_13555, partial [bacterium]|nr:hypothetical protein [bacterium]
MKRMLTIVLVLALAFALATSLAGCERKVKIRTGEIVICTAGEILEDNTEEVEVKESELAEYGVTTTVVTCDVHGGLGSLYDEAQAALAEGDLETAKARLETIVTTDPTYRKAKEQLDAIAAGQKPTPDTNTGSADNGGEPTTPPADEEPTGPVASLITYVPDTINGYVAQGIIADMASLNRQYVPTGGGADQLMIEVEQRVDAKQAESAVSSILSDYPDAQQEKSIGGMTVKAGVRGQFAVAVFSDGALTVIVELH